MSTPKQDITTFQCIITNLLLINPKNVNHLLLYESKIVEKLSFLE